MADASVPSASFDRYLRLLGAPARPPGLEALAELTAAHLRRVPFENVSKLLHRADRAMRLPPIDRYLDGIERFALGGTCYANNSHFGELLAHLGYDVRLCGADMSRPDVHVVNVVRLKGRDFLVDVGYGAPFTAPMPLDLATKHVIELGGDRYVLHPRGDDGRSRMELHRDGKPRHGYTLNPVPRRIEEFTSVIEDSFRPDATFMRAVLVIRLFPGRSRIVLNRQIVDCDGPSRRIEPIADAAALPGIMEERMGIPRELVARAIEGVELSADPWA